MPMSSLPDRPLYTLALQDRFAASPVKVQLIDNSNPHTSSLNGLEFISGMAWGELRKWTGAEMNHISIHPSLVDLLTEKQVLIVPTEGTLAVMQDIAATNKVAQKQEDRVHFHKRLPRQRYDYRVIASSTFTGQLSTHSDAPCPDSSVLDTVFQSDAHPFFILYYALKDLMRGHRADNFGWKEYGHIFSFFMLFHRRQPLYFFQRPYHGRSPRYPPDCYSNTIQTLRKRKASVEAGDSGAAHRPLKRLRRAAGDNEWHGIESWRRGVTDVEPVQSPCDPTLRSYARERARPGRVLAGTDRLAHSSRRAIAAS